MCTIDDDTAYMSAKLCSFLSSRHSIKHSSGTQIKQIGHNLTLQYVGGGLYKNTGMLHSKNLKVKYNQQNLGSKSQTGKTQQSIFNTEKW